MYGWDVKVSGNTAHYRKELYDAYGNHVGTIGICKPTKQTGKKKKAALYSFKQVSSQVLAAKTSGKASQVSTSIRMKIGLLRKQLKNGDYDEEEILRAILHAEMVQRACDKKKKNLKMEERAERGIESEEEMPLEPEETIDEEASEEEIKELEQEEFEALMEKLEMAAEDLKYLKALFDRLQSEKENAGKASFAGGYDSGVSLSLGGMDMPVTTTSSQSMPVETGGSFDATV